jgi:hypothetical protein
MAAPFATSGLQEIVAQNGEVIANDCIGSPNATCYIGNSGLPEQMTGLDSLAALLVGRAADSSSGGSGGSSTTTTGGGSSPTKKSASSRVEFTVSWFFTALFVFSAYVLLS